MQQSSAEERDTPVRALHRQEATAFLSSRGLDPESVANEHPYLLVKNGARKRSRHSPEVLQLSQLPPQIWTPVTFVGVESGVRI